MSCTLSGNTLSSTNAININSNSNSNSNDANTDNVISLCSGNSQGNGDTTIRINSVNGGQRGGGSSQYATIFTSIDGDSGSILNISAVKGLILDTGNADGTIFFSYNNSVKGIFSYDQTTHGSTVTTTGFRIKSNDTNTNIILDAYDTNSSIFLIPHNEINFDYLTITQIASGSTPDNTGGLLLSSNSNMNIKSNTGVINLISSSNINLQSSTGSINLRNAESTYGKISNDNGLHIQSLGTNGIIIDSTNDIYFYGNKLHLQPVGGDAAYGEIYHGTSGGNITDLNIECKVGDLILKSPARVITPYNGATLGSQGIVNGVALQNIFGGVNSSQLGLYSYNYTTSRYVSNANSSDYILDSTSGAFSYGGTLTFNTFGCYLVSLNPNGFGNSGEMSVWCVVAGGDNYFANFINNTNGYISVGVMGTNIGGTTPITSGPGLFFYSGYSGTTNMSVMFSTMQIG
jgi:hypothetical protein